MSHCKVNPTFGTPTASAGVLAYVGHGSSKTPN